VIYGICGQFFLLHLILVHFMDHLSRPVTVCSAAVILGLDRHSSLSATPRHSRLTTTVPSEKKLLLCETFQLQAD